MNPILGGSIASILWGLSAVVVSRSTRIIGAQQVVAWVLILGLAMVAPVALYQGLPAHVSNGAWAWVILSGVTANVGLLMLYKALHIGKVGVVTPIASTEGAIAAILSVVILGESLSAAVGATLVVIVTGVVIVTLNGSRSDLHLRASLFAVTAALLFGVGLLSTARAGDDLGPYWTLTIARVVAIAIIVGPLALRGGMGWPRGAWWMVAFSGMCEVVGLTCFVKGSEQSVAITAVLGSQYAAVAAVASFLILGERLSRRQVAGVVLILAGVTVLAAIQS